MISSVIKDRYYSGKSQKKKSVSGKKEEGGKMPYKRRGSVVYSKSSGKWKKKQTCRSVAAAKKAIKLLKGLESGDIDKKDVGKKKRAVRKKARVR